jgi:hypothetical protein
MSYSIIPDEKLKVIKHKLIGVLDKSNMGKAWKDIAQMKEFLELGYNVLSDYREAEFNFKMEETTFLDQYIIESKELLIGKKGAVIVSKPLYTAISVLISEKFKKVPNYEVKIFSTEEAAVEWLAE